MCTVSVPPHWEKLVESSAQIELYTEKQVDTWQSLPELEKDPGDFSSDSSDAITLTANKVSEGAEQSEAVSINVESPHDATRVN